jgi:hypothetical protein
MSDDILHERMEALSRRLDECMDHHLRCERGLRFVVGVLKEIKPDLEFDEEAMTAEWGREKPHV